MFDRTITCANRISIVSERAQQARPRAAKHFLHAVPRVLIALWGAQGAGRWRQRVFALCYFSPLNKFSCCGGDN